MLKVALVLFLLLRLAGAATIRGAVVEQATGRPLAHSLVTVSAVGPERSTGGSISTRANSSGLFFFSGLHPGGYVLTGSRKGFATRRYGQKNWKAAGTPILLPDEDSTFIVELRLQRLGAITGAVWDENQVGLPDQDVAVYDTTRPPKFLTKVRTDDRGIYRIGELEPGRYYVRTRGSQLEEGSGPLPTFFKDSPGVEQAKMVDVDLDQQAIDVNMQPPVGKLFHITGSAPVPRQVMQVTIDLVSDMGTVSGSVDASGHFTFDQLSPGTYELSATAIVPQARLMLAGYLKLVVDHDLEGVSLPLGPLPELELVFENSRGQYVPARSMEVWARRKELAGEGPAKRLRPDNNESLAPGPWEISVVPPRDSYVTSISARGRSDTSPAAVNGWKEFSLAPGDRLLLKAVLSSSLAALSGTVTLSRDQPAAGAPVFLHPLDLEAGAGFTTLKTTRTDLAGHYRFTALPPGRYLLLSSFDFERPSQVELQAARAATASVKEGSETNQDLELFVSPP